jgi:hypothetical protein
MGLFKKKKKKKSLKGLQRQLFSCRKNRDVKTIFFCSANSFIGPRYNCNPIGKKFNTITKKGLSIKDVTWISGLHLIKEQCS